MTTTGPDGILVASREDWGARPPRYALSPFPSFPARRLFVHHSVTPTYGTDWRRAMRLVQEVAFGRGFSDFSYPLAVHPAGVLAEGRGVQWIGAHTAGYNSTALAIVFVGNYEVEPLTDRMVDVFRYAVGFLKATGRLAADAVAIDPHRLVSSTACPGIRVVNRLPELRRPWVGGLDNNNLNIGGLTVSDLTAAKLAQWHHDDRAFTAAVVDKAADRIVAKLARQGTRRREEAERIIELVTASGGTVDPEAIKDLVAAGVAQGAEDLADALRPMLTEELDAALAGAGTGLDAAELADAIAGNLAARLAD